MRLRTCVISLILFVLAGCLLAVVLYNLPPLHERLAWRLANWQAEIQRAINPPEELVFVPGGGGPQAVATIAQATLDVLLAGVTPSPTPPQPEPAQATFQPGPTLAAPASPTPTETATPTAIPIPSQARLEGIRHEYQQFNNCGPANLAMALSYWGWQGDQRDTRAYLRPNREVDDKNVMPSEMIAYVENFTGLRALTRVGGDVDLLKRLVAAGFPVLIEAGHHPRDDFWMGHYLVVSGYGDTAGAFTVQDSLTQPDLPMLYDELGGHWWRDFNYVYLVIYPPERESEVLGILGSQADPAYNFQHAAQKAQAEIPALQGRDQFFAWFNLGSSLVGLQDYPAASEAYDQAFAIYQTLPEEMRPYRLMWYQDGPYRAYYNSGRYQDVVDLANITFSWVGKPVLEESYYWRGLAYEALGRHNLAVIDLQKAAALNPNFAPPREKLQEWGEALP